MTPSIKERVSFCYSVDIKEPEEETHPEPDIKEDTSETYVQTNQSSSHVARFGVLRKSSDKFLTLCGSFDTKSPHDLAASVSAGVKTRFRESLSESLRNDYENKDCIAPFKTEELALGKLLGSGEFSHVYQIKSFCLDALDSLSMDEAETRAYMKGREKYRDTNKSSYALKHLRPELIAKYKTSEYAQFASDLVQEAEFLSLLQHPNIIKLRGISLIDFMGFQQGPKGYFLIIDRLDETLVDRIEKWKKDTKPKRKNWVTNAVNKPMKKKDSEGEQGGLLSKQLEVVLQIAAAVVYLHEKNIIFRDLKPANVGFDVRGDVKLFDFGLARMMPSNGDSYTDVFEMSGAGSPRYMAPEVLASEPCYNLKADVYTFSIVLWEVLALVKPYAFVRSRDALVSHVLDGGRPDMRDEWPSSIKNLLRMGFDASPDERPSMKFVFDAIRAELCEMRNGDASKLKRSYLLRRRSWESMRNLSLSDTTKQSNVKGKLGSFGKFGRKTTLV